MRSESRRHTTQICDISSDPPPKLRNLSKAGSKRGNATTNTDIRFKSRFEASGEFHRDIPPPTPRSEATVCAVTGGNIAELAATAFVALLTVLQSVRTFERSDTEENSVGAERVVSQSPLKDNAFLSFLDQNPPFELRPEDEFRFRQKPVRPMAHHRQRCHQATSESPPPDSHFRFA